MSTSTATARTDEAPVEVIDEATNVVMVFRTAADAELYGLTGVPNWMQVRVPRPDDVVSLSLTDLARAL
ncbi:hypothetical protein [Nocardioides pakistanensis]